MNGSLDAHVHVWDRSTDPQPWIDSETMSAIDRDFSLGDAAAMLDDVGVERAIVVQAGNSAAETTRLLARATTRIAGVVGWLDLTADVRRQLDEFSLAERSRLVGARHLVHVDPDPEWLARLDVIDGLRVLADERLSFDLVVRWWQLPLADAAAAAVPELTLVLDHLGGPPLGSADIGAWKTSLRALALRPNVVAKLSGIAGEVRRPDWGPADCAPAVDVAFEAFGPNRLMYGSDWPLVQMVGGAAKWRAAVDDWTAQLTEGERDAINGRVAVAAYRIGEVGSA